MGFCRNMSRRSYQYAVRSTYALFDNKSAKHDLFSSPKSSGKSSKSQEVLDKNGTPYNYHMRAKFKDTVYFIEEVRGKMLLLSDGKKHRASSCVFVS